MRSDKTQSDCNDRIETRTLPAAAFAEISHVVCPERFAGYPRGYTADLAARAVTILLLLR